MIENYGGADVLQMRMDMPRPRATPGHVLVKVACAGISFMDLHTRQGKYATSVTYPVRLPCTLGMEGAGEVVEAGEGVGAFFQVIESPGALPGVPTPSTPAFRLRDWQKSLMRFLTISRRRQFSRIQPPIIW
nr:alcohol dehydrogenase catalytic domain-containing protein [Pseudomonas sp.]